MSIETAKKVVDMAKSKGNNAGIIFFGGEPLLHKDLIFETIEYAKYVQKDSMMFHFKVTTNGTLLDDDFFKYSKENNLFIALSHDGIKEAHDTNRVFSNGDGTFDILDSVIDKLLNTRPYAPVLMTIDPSVVKHYAEGVKYLYSKGFKYLICTINFAGNWDESALIELKRQYKVLAEFYKDLTIKEQKFYLSPFEVKMASHIRNKTYKSERCELGLKQISISPAGMIYPCVQFVGHDEYSIGDIHNGIDEYRRTALYGLNEEDKNSCADCAVKSRCNNHCGCLNFQVTGNLNNVAPSLCAHERILLPIADNLAGELYKKRSGMFIQKQYNDMFPLISLLDDKL